MAPADQKKSAFEVVDREVEVFALAAVDKPVKFRQTQRMKRLNKGRVPYNEENFRDRDYISECLSDKNYRMLFAYMNTYGYGRISFEMAFKIPLFDVLAVFPQGCFSPIPFSEQPNILCIDSLIIYCWLFGKIGDVVYALFKAVLYMKIDFTIISKLDDLKHHLFEVIKKILRNDVYRTVIMKNHINIYDDSKFLGKSVRQDVTGIRNDVIRLVNSFLQLMDPYLNFYEENHQAYRVAFLPWSLPLVDFDYFSQYNDRLAPFRRGVFDFGPLPVWSKATHLKYPLEFRNQVKTILLMKARKGTVVNRWFHKDLLVMLFQYMAVHSLLLQEEDTKDHYHCSINDCRREEDEEYGRAPKHCEKRQRQTE
jgi:hypothetical protein